MNKVFIACAFVALIAAVLGLSDARHSRAKFEGIQGPPTRQYDCPDCWKVFYGCRLSAQGTGFCPTCFFFARTLLLAKNDYNQCIDFMVAAINYYANYWLQSTLPSSCSKLCNTVEPKHNNTCTLYCELYGVYEFVQLLTRVDLDPIFMCQESKGCLIQDCTAPSCATIIDVTVSPRIVKRGDQLKVTGTWKATHHAGAGMLRLMSQTAVDGGWTKGPTDYLVSAYQPGTYQTTYYVNTENLQPGPWTSTFFVCEGGCDSTWPHTRLFDAKNVSWHMPN